MRVELKALPLLREVVNVVISIVITMIIMYN